MTIDCTDVTSVKLKLPVKNSAKEAAFEWAARYHMSALDFERFSMAGELQNEMTKRLALEGDTGKVTQARIHYKQRL